MQTQIEMKMKSSNLPNARTLFFFLVLLHLVIGSSSTRTASPKGNVSGDGKKINPQSQAESLSFTHYEKSCPDVEGIIQRKVASWIKKDSSLAPSLIRLHFHDCAVRGCDGSILLNHVNSERTAKASNHLRGFEVIDDIKAELERKCPKTVSCADILTAAARDATVDAGGPFWAVPFGRKDGLFSLAKEAERQVPVGNEDVTTLLKFCKNRGLNVLDLVVLSGVHTIGRSSCDSINERLHNFNKTGKADPSMDMKYLNTLKKECSISGSSKTKTTTFVHLDVTTPTTFDPIYYKNLKNKKGLLRTDQVLNLDPRTSPFVEAFASQPTIFDPQFAASMVKLGNVNVLVGKKQGQIRLKCGVVNR